VVGDQNAAAPGGGTAQHIGVQGVAHHRQPFRHKACACDAFAKSLGEGFAEPVGPDLQPVHKIMAEKARLHCQAAFARGDQIRIGNHKGARLVLQRGLKLALQHGRPARRGQKKNSIRIPKRTRIRRRVQHPCRDVGKAVARRRDRGPGGARRNSFQPGNGDIARRDNFVSGEVKAKPVILGQKLRPCIACGIRQDDQLLAPRPQAGQPGYCPGDRRFAHIQHAKGIQKEAVNMVGHLFQRCHLHRLCRKARHGQTRADRLIPREGGFGIRQDARERSIQRKHVRHL